MEWDSGEDDMSAKRSRNRSHHRTHWRMHRAGAAGGPMLGLLLGIALAVIGLVFLIQGIRAANEGYAMMAFGIAVESALPGVILLVIAAAIAVWSLVALGGGGRPRHAFGTSGIVAWNNQPPTGVKEFGNPPALPSHRAELAAAGLEAYPLVSGQWGVRRLVR